MEAGENQPVPAQPRRFRDRGLARGLRYWWRRLWRLRGDPFALARGVGIGVCVGMTPTIPFHTVLILIFCVLGRGNAVAGVLASLLVSNPFTIPFQYYGAWKIGTYLSGDPISWQQARAIMGGVRDAGFLGAASFLYDHGPSFVESFLVGGIVLALPFGVAAYFLALALYLKHQRRRQMRALVRRPGKCP